MNDGWVELASELLGFTRDEPGPRALRTAAIYASLFEEDPLLHEWCGVAAAFARLHAESLAVGVGFYDEILARWNRASYDAVIPALLALRAGEDVEGPLAEPFALLIEARGLRKADRPRAMALARRGTEALLMAEQEVAVQPLFDGLPEIIFRGLGPYVGVSFGEGEPLIYEREGFTSLLERQRWVREVILPEWRRALSAEGAEVVRVIRTMQFKGWFAVKDLPPRSPPPAG